MKYIVFTAKHGDSFAMYHSQVSSCNVYDATPFHRDWIAIAFPGLSIWRCRPGAQLCVNFSGCSLCFWVNEIYVECGSDRFQSQGAEYDTINLAFHLQPVRNVLASWSSENLSIGVTIHVLMKG